MKKQHQPTLAETAYELRTKKIKNNFLSEVNALIDWHPSILTLESSKSEYKLLHKKHIK